MFFSIVKKMGEKAFCGIGKKIAGTVAKAATNVFRFVMKSFAVGGEVVAIALAFASLGVGFWFAASDNGLNLWRFILPLKFLGVFIGGAGCFLSGVVFLKSNAAALKADIEKAWQEAEKRGRDLEKKEAEENALRKELDDARSRLSNAQDELDDRRGRGLDIGTVRSIAELNLAEVEMTIDKFHGNEWEEPSFPTDYNIIGKRPVTITDPTVYRFLGLLRRSCIVKYGIDMKQVRFFETPTEIVVYNLNAKVTGVLNTSQDEWPLEQVQKYVLKRIDGADSDAPLFGKTWEHNGRRYAVDKTCLDFTGSFSHDKHPIQDYKNKWASDLTKDIQNGCEIKGIGSYVTGMAEEILRMLLPEKKTGKALKFDKRPREVIEAELANLGMSPGLALEDFAQNYNRRLLEAPV